MIVITTPTGLIGRQVLVNLLDGGEQVRVIARDPGKLPARSRGRVEIVTGSHGDPDVVGRAFDGADAVFWLVPPDPRAPSVHAAYVDFSRPAARAIARTGVRRVVAVSALGRGVPGEAGFVTGSLAMEDLIAGTGVSLRALAMPSFMDNLLRQLGPVREQGVFFSPIAGDLKLPTVATRDVAEVAARRLLDDTWTGQETVPVLGAEDLSFDDMAATLSEGLGTPVRFQRISDEAYRTSFVRLGMSEAMAQGMLDMATAKNDGLDLSVPRTPQNTTSTTFRRWAEEVFRPAYQGRAAAS